MRRLAVALLSAMAATYAVRAQAPAVPASRSIRGQVVDGLSGVALRRARVAASFPGTPQTFIFTDDEGRFVVDAPAPAELMIRAGKGGYTTEATVVPADVTTAELRLALTPSAAVEGNVRNGFGAPVRNAYVTARLLAAAVARDRDAATRFHPGGLSLSGSQHVTVDAGRDAHEINIQLVPRFAATVTGTALDATGRPLAGTVRLSPSARSGAVLGLPLTVPLDGEGRFVARGVTSGEYVASAVHSSNGRRQFGVQFVTVADDDPAPVALRTSAGATITGRVLIDGVPASDEAGITVSAHPANPDLVPHNTPGWSTTPQSVLQNGTFQLADVMGPSRLLVYAPRCASCYVEWAFVNGADASQRPFDFRTNGGRHDDVEIEVSSAGATVEGRVRNNRAGLAASMVVIFPADRELWTAPSPHVKTASPSVADGAFRLAGLPPGSNFIAAVGASFTNRFGSRGNAFEDPQALEQLMPRARSITLRERGRLALDLDPLP